MHEKRVLPTSSVELQTAPVPHGVGFPAAISVGMRLFSGYREMWWFFEILSTYILNYHTDRWYLGTSHGPHWPFLIFQISLLKTVKQYPSSRISSTQGSHAASFPYRSHTIFSASSELSAYTTPTFLAILAWVRGEQRVIQKKYGFFLLHPSMKNTSSPLLYEDARRISSNVQYFPQKTELLGNPRALYILLNDNFVSHYGADFPGTEAHGITLHLFLDSLDSVVFSAADGQSLLV